MKLPIPHVLIVVNVIQAFASSNSIKEVCDIEGSGLEDCPIDTYCCKLSKCHELNDKQNPYIDIEYDFESESSNKRCCDSSERNKIPKPEDCKVCTECCDEVERKKTPLPDHCSKCRRCYHSTDIETG